MDTIALEIEESLSGALVAHVQLFVADVLVSFHRVDKGSQIGCSVILDCLPGSDILILKIMHKFGYSSSWLIDLVNLGP